ncbi:MAG: phage tail protein, partial [Pseudomonadota bacterium]
MPAAIGTAVLAVLGPIGTGLTAAGVTAAQVGGFVLTAAAVGAQLLFRPRVPRAPQPDDLKNTSESEEGPGRFAFGRVRVGAKVVFGKTREYEIFQLLAHYHGPTAGIEEWFYDGRVIIVSETGKVASPPFAKFRDNSFITLEHKPGDGTETSYLALRQAFTGQWTTAHRLRGIAQTLAIFENPGQASPKFTRLYNGGIKQLERVERAGEFFDPRDGETRWTMNSALICLHYRRLRPGVTLADFDLDDIAVTADACDALVNTRNGPEPRSQLTGGGEGQITIEMLADMYRSAGLEERRTAEGKITFRLIEDNPSAEIAFTDRRIIDRVLTKGPEGVQRPNVCRVKYFSPERQYTVAEIPLQTFDGPGATYDGPAWARVEDEIAAYGEHETTVELPFCPSAAQAQRIARRQFHEERAAGGAILTTF